jgi:hypothetical protein
MYLSSIVCGHKTYHQPISPAPVAFIIDLVPLPHQHTRDSQLQWQALPPFPRLKDGVSIQNYWTVNNQLGKYRSHKHQQNMNHHLCIIFVCHIRMLSISS